MSHFARHIILALLAIMFCTATFSCSNSACTDNSSSIPLAGFYSSSTKKSVTVDSLKIYGVDVPNDSVLSNNRSISQIYLPMPLGGNHVRWVIHYNHQILNHVSYNDTISVHYEAVPYFTSAECGAFYEYRIINYKYTQHLVDSVAFTSSLITNRDIETIKIFFRGDD